MLERVQNLTSVYAGANNPEHQQDSSSRAYWLSFQPEQLALSYCQYMVGVRGVQRIGLVPTVTVHLKDKMLFLRRGKVSYLSTCQRL